ncbi:MAG: flagellar protein FlgN [Oligoflexia bacterium]|nr:flagellar protein FlgN [Oligoflexia bacterium]
MERFLEQLNQALQKLIGLHRQLLETVRMEREALVHADLKTIQESVYAKQALIETVHQVEAARMKAIAELALIWKKPLREMTLSNIAIAIQGRDPKGAEQLRSAYNALTILIKRVTEQNDSNRVLVDRSLEHVHEMKKNVLGESRPKTDVYSQRGQRVNGASEARFISKEV